MGLKRVPNDQDAAKRFFPNPRAEEAVYELSFWGHLILCPFFQVLACENSFIAAPIRRVSHRCTANCIIGILPINLR